MESRNLKSEEFAYPADEIFLEIIFQTNSFIQADEAPFNYQRLFRCSKSICY